jgi:hypothetical protein
MLDKEEFMKLDYALDEASATLSGRNDDGAQMAEVTAHLDGDPDEIWLYCFHKELGRMAKFGDQYASGTTIDGRSIKVRGEDRGIFFHCVTELLRRMMDHTNQWRAIVLKLKQSGIIVGNERYDDAEYLAKIQSRFEKQKRDWFSARRTK